MIFVYSRASYITYVPLQISCRVPLEIHQKYITLLKSKSIEENHENEKRKENKKD